MADNPREKYNYNEGKKTKYSCPTKQLGFGSTGKYKNKNKQNKPPDLSDYDDEPKTCFDNVTIEVIQQAYEIIETQRLSFEKIINKRVYNEYARQIVWEDLVLKSVINSCRIFDSSKNIPLLSFVFHQLIFVLKSFCTQSQSRSTATLIPIPFDYIAIAEPPLSARLSAILQNWIKDNCEPLQRMIYRLSYIEGRSDPEIAKIVGIERSAITRRREEIINKIIRHKAEIEQLF